MKTLLIRVPVRPEPTMYPPFGSMAIMQSLRQEKLDFEYYDLDVHRDSDNTIAERIQKSNAPIIGISAVVSTAYKRTLELLSIIKSVSPNSIVIIGGGLAWNAKLLIEKDGVDFCVIGEGLLTIKELTKSIIQYNASIPEDICREIKGIAFRNNNGEAEFSDFRPQIDLMEQEIDDFSLVDHKFFHINPIVEVKDSGWLRFKEDPRSYEPQRKGKKLHVMVSSKGCVAKCTFCHRMEKGIRLKKLDKILHEIKIAIRKYNAGFFFFGDEDFGASKDWVDEFCEAIKPLDILFAIQGMRVNHATPENLKKLYSVGAVSIFYGQESFSQKMLQVMQKGTKLEQNINACIWTIKAKIWTSYQFVLAMPGETNETIKESIYNLNTITEQIIKREDIAISSKYILCLPGTPVYEYAVRKKFIGSSIEDEQKFLLQVSDYDPDVYNEGFINFTDCDFYTVCNWSVMVDWEPYIHWDKVHGNSRSLISSIYLLFTKKGFHKLVTEKNPYLYYLVMGPFNLLFNIIRDIKHGASYKLVFKHVLEYARYRLYSKAEKFNEYVSLRKNSIMENSVNLVEHDSIKLLRKGR